MESKHRCNETGYGHLHTDREVFNFSQGGTVIGHPIMVPKDDVAIQVYEINCIAGAIL